MQAGEEAEAPRDPPGYLTHQQRMERELAEVDRETRRVMNLGEPEARQENADEVERGLEDVAEEELQDEQEQGPKQEVLAGWVDPYIPEPGISLELEPDGWDLVDRVGAWDAFLCQF